MNDKIRQLSEALATELDKNSYSGAEISSAIARELLANYNGQLVVYVFMDVEPGNPIEYLAVEKIQENILTNPFSLRLTGTIDSPLISIREVYSGNEIKELENQNSEQHLYIFTGGITPPMETYPLSGIAAGCESVDFAVHNNKISAYLATRRPMETGIRRLIKVYPISTGTVSGVATDGTFLYADNNEFLENPFK